MENNNQEKTISINELKNNQSTEKPDRSNLEAVSISEIRSYANEQPGSDEPNIIDQTFDAIDRVIIEKAEAAASVRAQIADHEAEKQLDAEIEEDVEEVTAELPAMRHDIPSDEEKEAIMSELEEYLADEEEPVKAEPVSEEKKASPMKTIDEDDFDALLSDDEDEISADDDISEAELNNMKNEIKAKILPYKNNVDFSKFSISKKHIPVNRIFNETSQKSYVADWALPSTGKAISMSEFTGTEIEKLNPGNMGRNRINRIKDVYRLIYEHVVDPNKSPSLEVWAKSISFYDIDHLYFAIYKASFEGSNHIPYHCTECNKVFLQEVSDINSMVKYKSTKAEEYIKSLLNKDTSNSTDAYETHLVQVSDDIAVALRRPSIFNVTFENAVLDERFTDKYQDLLALLVYIDAMYYINRETNELVEIETNPDPSNLEKTVKKKVVRYTKVIQSLTSDQFYELSAKIKDLNDRNEYIDYVLPAAVCPHCGKSIEEEVKTPENLLFTRHQLAALANI